MIAYILIVLKMAIKTKMIVLNMTIFALVLKNLKKKHRDYMTQLSLLLAEDPGIWEDVTDFLMSGCKRIFRSARRRAPITCFNEFSTDRDQFEYLKAKLEHKPECVEDLVQHLYNDRD